MGNSGQPTVVRLWVRIETLIVCHSIGWRFSIAQFLPNFSSHQQTFLQKFPSSPPFGDILTMNQLGFFGMLVWWTTQLFPRNHFYLRPLYEGICHAYNLYCA